ncbi:hypothetical protein A943_18490 [Bacillus sp. CPSM8]|nr:hypothetical protein A943_18490 [Bacillus sp. CPSM8]KUL14435.1 hypothetical protein LI7559_02040 [Bacillus licheniformis LMG 7559]
MTFAKKGNGTPPFLFFLFLNLSFDTVMRRKREGGLT